MAALDFGEIRLDNGVVTLWDGTGWRLLADLLPSGGPGGGTGYVHHQSTPAAVWTINHVLGYFPNVLVIDSAGNNVEGTVAEPSANQMVITFSGAFTGTAYLS